MLAGRPDLPTVEMCSDGFYRLNYGGCRGFRRYAFAEDAYKAMVEYIVQEIDAHILYLDELRRLRNRVTKQLKDREEF